MQSAETIQLEVTYQSEKEGEEKDVVELKVR